MVLPAPVAWPIAEFLDFLRLHDAHTNKKAKLEAFLQFHRTGRIRSGQMRLMAYWSSTRRRSRLLFYFQSAWEGDWSVDAGFNVYVGFSFGILHSVFFPTPEMTLPCLWAQFLCLWGINNNSKITQKERGKLKGIIKICLPAAQRI